MSVQRLVGDPDRSYSELAAGLRAAGWTWEAEPQDIPLEPGEPLWSRWSFADAKTLLVYTYDAALKLRVLAFEGPEASSLRDHTSVHVPWLDVADLRALLAHDSLERLLLGLLAVRELGAVGLSPEVQRLSRHADPLVAETAGEVLRVLPLEAMEGRRDRLREFLRAVPDGIPFGLGLDDPGERCQFLRELPRWEVAQTERDGLLRAALHDADWEVRVTALVIAARFGSRALLRYLKDPPLPLPGTPGLSQEDHHWIHGVARACARQLAKRPVDSDPRAAHLRTLVSGERDGIYDAGFRWVRSLGTPLDAGPPPRELPEGVVADEVAARLVRSRIAVERVAAVPCWLGPDDDLHQVIPARALGVGVAPLSRGELAWIEDGGGVPRQADPMDLRDDAVIDFDRAQAAIAALADVEGVPLRLPSPDQWERAARGTDARRYPWGNTQARRAGSRATPWGLHRMVADAPTWARTPRGEPVLVGLPDDPRCAARRAPREADRGVIRFVWDLDTD